MTVLYSNTFEAETLNTVPSGWNVGSTDWRTRSGFQVRGSNGFSASSNGDAAWWEGAWLGSQAIRIAQIFRSSSRVTCLLRRNGTNSQHYEVGYEWDGTNLRGFITKNDSGGAGNWYGPYDIPCTGGNVVHMEASAVGSTIAVRVWVGGAARPASASVSMSDSSFSGGYPGVFKRGAFEYTTADDLVITDAAGGEDFFYGPPTLTGSVTLDNMAPTGSMFTQPLSSLAGTVLLDDMLASGTLGLQPGVITSQPFKNSSGTLLAGVTIPKVAIVRISDMVTVLNLTNQVTNGSGVLSITSSAMVPGVRYLLVTCDAAGTAFGAEPYTTG